MGEHANTYLALDTDSNFRGFVLSKKIVIYLFSYTLFAANDKSRVLPWIVRLYVEIIHEL